MIVTVNGDPAPSHSSVAADGDGVLPPNAKARDLVPAPAKEALAVAKLTGDVVQLVPSYSSVAVS